MWYEILILRGPSKYLKDEKISVKIKNKCYLLKIDFKTNEAWGMVHQISD